MNRRTFLKGLAASGLALAGVPSCAKKPENAKTQSLEQLTETNKLSRELPELTEANRLLREFPAVIPGAANIRKYETPGAKYCLVHVRRKHLMDGDYKKVENKVKMFLQKTEKGRDEINNNERGVYQILAYLAQRGIINSVYMDGLTQEDWDKIQKKNLIESLATPDNDEFELRKGFLEHELTGIPYECPEDMSVEEYRANIRKEIEELNKKEAEFKEKYKFLNGGALRLVYEGKLQPRFEDTAALRKTDDLIEGSKEDFVKYVLDARESKILERIAAEGKYIAATDFGGGHAFAGKTSFPDYKYGSRDPINEDNIAAWNAQHPDEKFSLIEIIAEGYEEGEK